MNERTPAKAALVALHEAGHAVVAFDLGIRLSAVTIEPDKWRDREGSVKAEELREDFTDEDLHNRAVVAMAGVAVDQVLGQEHGHEDDAVRAVALAEIIAPDNRPRADLIAGRAALVAGSIVALRWPVIKRFADVLLERRSLNGWRAAKYIAEIERDCPPGPEELARSKKILALGKKLAENAMKTGEPHPVPVTFREENCGYVIRKLA